MSGVLAFSRRVLYWIGVTFCLNLIVGSIPGMERFHPQNDPYRVLAIGLIVAVGMRVLELSSRNSAISNQSGEQA